MRRIVVFAALCAVSLLGACDDSAAEAEKLIAATCSQRMTIARTHSDSLSVLLACDQMRMIAGAQQKASDYAASGGVATGLAIGLATGLR